LSFRPKQTDTFSSAFAPAKVSVCAAEKSLFVLSRSRLDTRLSTRQLDILISHLLEEIHAYAILIFTARGAGENHDVI
jgi:hypothetical protein